MCLLMMMESSAWVHWGVEICLSSSPNLLTFGHLYDPTSPQFPPLQNEDKDAFYPSWMGSLGSAFISVSVGLVCLP
jgi:hypothetical protein